MGGQNRSFWTCLIFPWFCLGFYIIIWSSFTALGHKVTDTTTEVAFSDPDGILFILFLFWPNLCSDLHFFATYTNNIPGWLHEAPWIPTSLDQYSGHVHCLNQKTLYQKAIDRSNKERVHCRERVNWHDWTPKKRKKERKGGEGVLCDCSHPWGRPNIKRIKIKETKRLWSIVLLWPPPPWMGVGSKETKKDFGVLCCCGHRSMDGWMGSDDVKETKDFFTRSHPHNTRKFTWWELLSLFLALNPKNGFKVNIGGISSSGSFFFGFICMTPPLCVLYVCVCV